MDVFLIKHSIHGVFLHQKSRKERIKVTYDFFDAKKYLSRKVAEKALMKLPTTKQGEFPWQVVEESFEIK